MEDFFWIIAMFAAWEIYTYYERKNEQEVQNEKNKNSDKSKNS